MSSFRVLVKCGNTVSVLTPQFSCLDLRFNASIKPLAAYFDVVYEIVAPIGKYEIIDETPTM